MRQSACFVAVIPRRDEPASLGCSPYQFYEIGLAVRSRKPAIVFVEQGISDRVGAGIAKRFSFNRKTLDDSKRLFKREINDIAGRAKPYRMDGLHSLGKIGVIVDKNENVGDETRMSIESQATSLGFTIEDKLVDISEAPANRILEATDDCAAVIATLPLSDSNSWILPLIHGRFIPCIRLAKKNEPILQRELAGAEREWPVVGGSEISRWQEHAELQEIVVGHLQKIKNGVVEFGTLEEGEKYFRSAGREPMSVFVSNAAADNELAAAVAVELSKNNFEVFQYRVANSIRAGDLWPEALEKLIISSQFFVAILSEAYQKSDACRMEIEFARKISGGGIKIIPFVVDKLGGKIFGELKIMEHGPDISDQDKENKVNTIVSRLDKIRIDALGGQRKAPPEDFQSADIAVVTLLPEEYMAACAILEQPRTPKPPPNGPNQHAPKIGEVRGVHGVYRIVVCLVGRQTNPVSAAATMSIVNRWNPSYVVALGVAGGLPRDGLTLGDVAVSDVIWNYEYGKVSGEYEPRNDYTYQHYCPVDGERTLGRHLKRSGFQAFLRGVDLKLVAISRTLFRGGPAYERRKDDILAADGLPALEHVRSARSASSRRPRCANISVHRAIPCHGLRPTDVPGKPARHRSMSVGPTHEALAYGLSRIGPAVDAGRCQ